MRIHLLPILALLSGCAGQIPVRQPPAQVIAPALAVVAAADAAPNGVPGRFGFVVQRAEWVGPRLFLNSQPDYRDQRNLSISIDPVAIGGLRQMFGDDLRSALLYKPIVVDGVARRIQIDFTVNGRRTGKYYYQTHIIVTDPAQLHVAA